jgi:transposase
MSFGDISEPIVAEDNAPIHNTGCILARKKLGMKCHEHPPNSPDLNPIEKIWAHMKNIIAKDYSHITSEKEMMRVVVKIWNEFEDNI